MLAPNPIIERADEIAGLYDVACVDIFAGCGGWSIGAEQAFVDGGFRDKRIDLMVNHWTTAVAVHTVNHPLTHHLRADVREVDPADVLPGRRIAYLHASPDCTDHSKAKGGKPRRKEIRALADVVIVWAAKRRPDVITLENVEEFRQWGPLLDCGTPDPSRRGNEFKRWVGELEALGYDVEARELRACDYGAPTTRKRLFVVARCDGKPIVWPEKTHGKEVQDHRTDVEAEARRHRGRAADGELRVDRTGAEGGLQRDAGRHAPDIQVLQHGRRDVQGRPRYRVQTTALKPYLTAADCIDWSIPMLSIFATPDEAKAFARQHGVGTPRRPLKPKTLARIAGGLDKFVIKAARPFIVNIENYGWNSGGVRAADEPLSTVTAGPKGGKHAAVDVTLAPYSIPRYGERPGQPPRCQSINEPAATITGTGNGTNLVAATLVRCAHGDDSNGGKRWGASAHDVEQPLPTVTGSKDYGVAVAHLQTLNHGGPEHRATSPDAPLPTVCGSNDARALVAALVTKHYSGVTGSPADAPLDTVTATDHNAVTCAHLMKFRGDSVGTPADEPVPTVTSGAGAARDAGAAHALGVSVAYLSHFYTSNSRGGEGDPLKPAKTITSGGQHAAVTVAMATPVADEPAKDRRAIVAAFLATYYGNGGTFTPGDPMPTVVGKDRIQLVTVVIDGTTYVVTDIAMRMLTPRELANAQGFPADYVIDRTADGKPVSKADQVKLIGNAVPPAFARAIVKANVVDQGVLGTPPRQKRRRRSREAVMA